jgi:hypothetical protein
MYLIDIYLYIFLKIVLNNYARSPLFRCPIEKVNFAGFQGTFGANDQKILGCDHMFQNLRILAID